MIKRILALAIVLTTVVVFAGYGCSKQSLGGLKETPASDFKYNYNASINGIEITEYIGFSTKVHIPEKIEGEPVVKIGGGAFKGSGITEVYIPNTVTYIGNYTFYQCTKLTNITIPDSVTWLGGYAVSSYTELTYKGDKYDLSGQESINALYRAINGEQ